MWSDASALAGLLLLVGAVYLPTLNDYFHGDDFLAFIDLTTKAPVHYLRDVITYNDSNVYWRPLGSVYFLLLYLAAGLDPFYFHLANLLLFLVTLALLYRFCLKLGLGRPVALGAVLVFGLLPNHVISVAWTTNGPRVLATMFALGSLVLVQEGLRTGQKRYEVLAFLAMVLALLSDETCAVLAPLPVLYAFLARPKTRSVGLAVCALFYGGLGAGVSLLQVLVGTADHPAPAFTGLSELKVGPHIFNQAWALGAKLVLPVRDGVDFASIETAQWVAAAVAGVIAIALLLVGSNRARFLVVWILLGLAPFTLWSVPLAPARYVYMSAVPFAILVSWAVVSAVEWLRSTRGWTWLRRLHLVPVATGLALAAGMVVLGLSIRETEHRNDSFAQAASPYRVLAEDLPRVLPTVPHGSRVVIYYSVWAGFASWRDAVLQTVYKDPSLRVTSVDWATSEEVSSSTRPGDVVVYYTDRGFILPAPKRAP